MCASFLLVIGLREEVTSALNEYAGTGRYTCSTGLAEDGRKSRLVQVNVTSDCQLVRSEPRPSAHFYYLLIICQMRVVPLRNLICWRNSKALFEPYEKDALAVAQPFADTGSHP